MELIGLPFAMAACALKKGSISLETRNKMSCFFGVVLNSLSLFALTFATKETDWLIVLGGISAGISVPFVRLPAFYILKYFPEKHLYVVHANLACNWMCSVTLYYMSISLQRLFDADIKVIQPIFSSIGLSLGIIFIYFLPSKPRDQCSDSLAKTPRATFQDILLVLKNLDINIMATFVMTPIAIACNTYFTAVGLLVPEQADVILYHQCVLQAVLQFSYAFVAWLGDEGGEGWFLWPPFGFMYIGNFIGLLSMLTTDPAGTGGLSWTAFGVTLFLMGNSFVLASKFALATKLFDKRLSPPILGIMSFGAGVVILCNMGMRKYAVYQDDPIAGIRATIWWQIYYMPVGALILVYCARRIEGGHLDHLKDIGKEISPSESDTEDDVAGRSSLSISILEDIRNPPLSEVFSESFWTSQGLSLDTY